MSAITYTAAGTVTPPNVIDRSYGLAAAACAITAITAMVWLCASIGPPSRDLAQVFGAAILAVLVTYLAVTVIWHPSEICRPVNVFFVGCIYFFVLDSALLREVSDLPPATLLATDTLVAVFLVTVIGTHALVRPGKSPWIGIIRHAATSIGGNVYFWVVLSAFALEYLRRMWFVDFSLTRLWHDLLLGRSGGAFRRTVAGDWRVVLIPISTFFLAVPAAASLAMRQPTSAWRKLVLLVVVIAQLGTLVLDGVRGDLLLAILFPVLIAAAQHHQSTGRWLVTLLFGSFLLSPVMDQMNNHRQGWLRESASPVSWNMAEAHRDDNFFWLANLVGYRRDDPGVLEYQGYTGFVAGLSDLGLQWLEMPVPRMVWPGKPQWWTIHDETRTSSVTDSIVGDLFRAGGLSCLVAGAILFGLWLSFLDPVYAMPKTDGEAVAYVYLAAATIALTRTCSPIGPEDLIMTFFLFVFAFWLLAPRTVPREGDLAELNSADASFEPRRVWQ